MMKTTGSSGNQDVFVCPKTGRVIRPKPKTRWAAWLLPAAGLVSVAWFLVRVIPKPSRATYPCQRMAFPIASGFVAWLVGMVTTVVAFRKAKDFGRQHRALLAVACILVAAFAGLHTLLNAPATPADASTTVPQTANTPVGTAKGVCPGRVVLVHDPKSTNWNGSTGYWWNTANNDQTAVDNMMSLAIRTVAGKETDEAAWDAIFHYYNTTHGRGDVGYTAGEKINVKANLVASANWGDGRVNLTTYVQSAYVANVTVSPYMMLSLLRQLVYKAHVPQANISIGDSTCFFVSQHWDACHTEFPNVQYLDTLGLCGRVGVVSSSRRFYWSNGATATKADYVPQHNVDSTYFINFANLKAHEGGGVSLCGKNYYGTLIRKPGDSGWYDLHTALPWTSGTPGFGHYRTHTDFMAHGDFGGKGLLWLLDGLWGGKDAGTLPTKWTITPFNNDWPSSLLVSQDPVAIDSVGVDMCRAQTFSSNYPTNVTAADDYLHEAATINDPPSGIFYDPDHTGVRRSSLGVHEHWNNNTDRQYTRNLGTGNGIELLWFDVGDPGDVNRDKTVDVSDLMAVINATGKTRGQTGFDQKADLNFNGRVDVADLLQVINNMGKIYP